MKGESKEMRGRKFSPQRGFSEKNSVSATGKNKFRRKCCPPVNMGNFTFEKLKMACLNFIMNLKLNHDPKSTLVNQITHELHEIGELLDEL